MSGVFLFVLYIVEDELEWMWGGGGIFFIRIYMMWEIVNIMRKCLFSNWNLFR